MKIVSRFVVTVGSASGFAVFVDDADGVYLRRSDRLFVEGEPDETLQSYKEKLGHARKRNPVLAVLNAIPVKDLNNREIHLEAPDAKVAVILDDNKREVSRINA